MKSLSPRLAVFLIVFLDVMGFGLIIPSQPFLAQYLGASPALVTLLGTTYSLMQFLFAPIWGGLSDRFGRRPILLCTIAMTMIGHATFAAASSLVLLFLARALAGSGAANIATAQAVLADTHAPSERSRAMALVGAAFGLGFIFGPALGGLLFQVDHRAPAIFGAALAAVNLCFVFSALPETRSTSSETLSYRADMRDLVRAPSELRRLITTTLLYIIAFSLMEQSVGLFVEQHWISPLGSSHMEDATKRTSMFLVVVGITATFVQGFLVRRLLKTSRERLLLRVGLVTIALSLVAIPVCGELGNFSLFLITGAALALGSGLFNPSMAGLVSLASPPDKQGFGLAVNQSAAALGRIIGPTAAGALFSVSHNLPFLVAAILSVVALGVSSRIRTSPARALAIILALLSTSLPCAAAPEKSKPGVANYERPAVLKASEILPAALVKGQHHSVHERVTNDGYFNNYTLNSPFGTFEVEGQALLEIRIAEMNALAELDKLSSSSVFADAAYKAGKGVVMAPVNIVKKTARTVSDPDKMADTLAAVPEGAEKLFTWVYRKGKSAANAVGDAFSDSSDKPKSDGTPKQSERSTSDAVSDTLDQGKSFGLKFIGYTKRQREWFRKLQVNPYTSNELLRDEIMRVAGIETAVGVGFKFVPGLGLLGELSTFNTWYERAEKLSLYEDPDSIGKKNGKELLALGISSDDAKCFLEHPSFTPWTRRFISASLTSIGPEVPGHTAFIQAACQAKNEASTLYFVSVAEYLEKRHKRTPIKKLLTYRHIPAALMQDGALLLPLSVDYLFWTDEVARTLKDFKLAMLKPNGAKRFIVNTRGKISSLARESLTRLGADVQEGWS